MELYCAALITTQEKSQAVDTQGLNPFKKTGILMDAVEQRFVAKDNAASLKHFVVCSRSSECRCRRRQDNRRRPARRTCASCPEKLSREGKIKKNDSKNNR